MSEIDCSVRPIERTTTLILGMRPVNSACGDGDTFTVSISDFDEIFAKPISIGPILIEIGFVLLGGRHECHAQKQRTERSSQS